MDVGSCKSKISVFEARIVWSRVLVSNGRDARGYFLLQSQECKPMHVIGRFKLHAHTLSPCGWNFRFHLIVDCPSE